MSDKMILLNNYKCEFELDGQVYIVPRGAFEKRFNVYWFIGPLYPTLITKVIQNRDWLIKYKV